MCQEYSVQSYRPCWPAQLTQSAVVLSVVMWHFNVKHCVVVNTQFLWKYFTTAWSLQRKKIRFSLKNFELRIVESGCECMRSAINVEHVYLKFCWQSSLITRQEDLKDILLKENTRKQSQEDERWLWRRLWCQPRL